MTCCPICDRRVLKHSYSLKCCNCIHFDPDINFYCEQNIFSGFLRKYYTEDSFNENLISFCSDYKLSFSLCHVNIRSIKANITDFENYLNMMNIDFSIIGVTETWLSDVTCNFYSLEGYEHRPCTCQESEEVVEWCFTISHIVWYSEGRKPHADEKQTITSMTVLMTVPEYSQCTTSLYTIPNNGIHFGCQNT